jgi:hypothetical protein
MVCFEQDCGTKVTLAQVTILFKDETALLAKMNRFIEKKQLEMDPLVRWCPRKDCDGFARGKSIRTSSVKCPEC